VATFSDNFNRADSTDLGPNWVEDSGDWSIVGNTLRQGVFGNQYRKCRYAQQMDSVNVRASVDGRSSDLSIGFGVILRTTNTSSVVGYAGMGFGGDQFYILRLDPDETILAQGGTCQANTTYNIELQANGNNLTLRVNGSTLLTASDSTYSSSRWVGIVAYNSLETSNNSWVDNFETADLASGYSQALSGTLSSSGTVTRQSRRPVSGTLSSSGTMARQSRRPVSGVLSSSGGVLRQMSRTLVGTLSSSGSVLRQMSRNLIGALSSLGTLVNQTRRALSGDISSSGGLRTQTRREVEGLLPSFGGLLRGRTREEGGTVLPQGQLSRRGGRPFGGAVTFLGTVGWFRSLGQVLVGTLSTSGLLSRQIRQGIFGTLSPSGLLSRQIRRGIFGTLSSSGIVGWFRSLGQVLVGTLSTSGLLSRQIRRGTVGETPSFGETSRLTSRGLVGGLVSRGDVHRFVRQTTDRVVSFLGSLLRGGRDMSEPVGEVVVSEITGVVFFSEISGEVRVHEIDAQLVREE